MYVLARYAKQLHIQWGSIKQARKMLHSVRQIVSICWLVLRRWCELDMLNVLWTKNKWTQSLIHYRKKWIWFPAQKSLSCSNHDNIGHLVIWRISTVSFIINSMMPQHGTAVILWCWDVTKLQLLDPNQGLNIPFCVFFNLYRMDGNLKGLNGVFNWYNLLSNNNNNNARINTEFPRCSPMAWIHIHCVANRSFTVFVCVVVGRQTPRALHHSELPVGGQGPLQWANITLPVVFVCR